STDSHALPNLPEERRLRPLVALLEAMGVSVDQASDGGIGISMSRAGCYDAVITDLWMEGVSG
ncbi:MAG: hypothetical protein ACKVHE_17825, partial [Planctomycetales bacterium]